MDDARSPEEASGLPAYGPPTGPPDEVPAGFVPLRLVLQPSGLAVELSRPTMLLGRHSDVDVRLPLPDVSRRHCRFTFTDGCWHIYDLKSLNGVWVNGHAVDEAVVRPGDKVRIGGFTFVAESAEMPLPSVSPEVARGVLSNLLKSLPPRRNAS